MDTRLKDKVCLITGASGGIGREIAKLFAEEGALLVLQGNTQFSELEVFAREHGFADRALCLRYDVSDREVCFDAARQGAERFGRLDVCVANAGKWPTEDVSFEEMSEERLRATLDSNLFGAAFTAQAFMSELARSGPRADQDGASLIFTGSTAARFGERFHADYSISKAAMYGMVRSLKNEITRIDPYARVNVVEPGWTKTHMARPALAIDEVVQTVVKTLAVRQIARAADIARTVAFLASPALSRHISGEALTVAGGMEGRVLWDDGEIDVEEVRARLERE
jgi:3-oxoacyl-[acyl-carrier protein] reductase